MKSHMMTVLAVLLAFTVTACHHTKQVPLSTAASVPAATGSAEVGTDPNGNTRIAVTVNNLAPPDRLTPPATAYVVWIQPLGQAAQNAGLLKVEGEKLQGTFATTTPYKKFELLITAEGDPHATSPSGPVIMRQQVAR